MPITICPTQPNYFFLRSKSANKSAFIKITTISLVLLILFFVSITKSVAQSPVLINQTNDSQVPNNQLPTAQVPVGQVPTAQVPVGQVASNEISILATPIKIGDDRSLVLNPGEKRQIDLKVRNVSSQPVAVISKAQDFIVAEDGSTPIPINEDQTISNRWSLASWLTIVPNAQQLAPNQTAGLNVLIQVPEDALPGGHYAMVVHEPLPEGSLEAIDKNSNQNSVSQTQVSQKVGTLIYVVVAGPLNESAFLRDFNFPEFIEFGPVPFSIDVDNQSDIHITPQISVEIKNMFGKSVEIISLEPKNIFPLLSRQFSGQFDRIWGMGWYQATATMTYGESGQIAIAKTNFWFLPITLLLGFGAVVLGLIAILIAVRRHLIHRYQQNQQRIQELESKLEQMSNPNSESN
jgi:hypothetical protein